MPPPRETSVNIRISLTLPETIESLAYIFAGDSVGLSSNFCGGLRKTIFSATECVSAIQGHPTSLILALITRAYATSY